MEQEVWSARVVRPHERAAELLDHYEMARIEGIGEGVTKGEWYDERMSSFAEEEWDQRCASTPSTEV